MRVPRVSDGGCGFAPAVRPTSFVLACATGNDQLVNIHWSEWAGSVATGTGEHWYNSCNPNCASSRTWITTAAGIKLSYVVPTANGPIFRTLSYREIAAQMCDPGVRHQVASLEERIIAGQRFLSRGERPLSCGRRWPGR